MNEDLSTKPRAHDSSLKLFGLPRRARRRRQQKRNYLNFYGNLMKSSDAYLVRRARHARGQSLLDNTLVIRTADHGEMGMTHGGMRQKNFNFYEETIRVPLVYSNPQFFPRPCHVGRARLPRRLPADDGEPVDAPDSATRGLGRGGLLGLILRRPTRRAPQDHIVFTYDDFQAGQADGPYIPPPNHIVSDPREALEAREVLRRERQGAERLRDVRPEARSARAEEPRVQGT